MSRRQLPERWHRFLSLPVEGSRLPNKVNLEVVGDLHRRSDTAPQFNGNFIPVVLEHKQLRNANIFPDVKD